MRLPVISRNYYFKGEIFAFEADEMFFKDFANSVDIFYEKVGLQLELIDLRCSEELKLKFEKIIKLL